jgi:hypothetical protein
MFYIYRPSILIKLCTGLHRTALLYPALRCVYGESLMAMDWTRLGSTPDPHERDEGFEKKKDINWLSLCVHPSGDAHMHRKLDEKKKRTY